MDRSFAILGIREDATKQQVKEAYERRMKKLKTADYADDPEYAARKIAELRQAYDRAYSLASGADVDGSSSSAGGKATASHMKAHRENRRESDNDGIFDRELHPEREYNKPCGLAGTVKNAANLEDMKSELKGIAKNIKKTAEDFRDSTEQEKGAGKKTKRVFADSRKVDMDKKTMSRIVSIAVALITIAGAFLPMLSHFEREDYYVPESFVHTYTSEEDELLYETAQRVNSFMNDNFGYGSYGEIEQDTDEEMKPAVDKFIQIYTEWDSIEEATETLYLRYEDYYYAADAESSVKTQIETFLEFFEFEPYDYALGFENPFSGTKILTISDYMNFLNDYYENELQE